MSPVAAPGSVGASAETWDVAIIGGGMAGISLGALLAPHRRVILLERENAPGTHATGRSAALFAPGYGNAVIRALTAASRAQLLAAAEPAFTRPRPVMMIAATGDAATLDTVYDERPACYERLDARAAAALVPVIRADAIAGALLDRDAADIDVDRLLQHYLTLFRHARGRLLCGAECLGLHRATGGWTIRTTAGDVTAALVVNAAGAWADGVATLAGLAPIGLSPKRRTAALVDAPAVAGFDDWPAVIDAAGRFYFKPDAGKLLVSPSEETDVAPHDAYADDEALAEGIDRIAHVTTIEVVRKPRSWAGLRTFAADRTPVIGFDRSAPVPFLWLAGQGGYGIQAAPAMAAIAATLITAGPPPPFATPELLAALSPDRLRRSASG